MQRGKKPALSIIAWLKRNLATQVEQKFASRVVDRTERLCSNRLKRVARIQVGVLGRLPIVCQLYYWACFSGCCGNVRIGEIITRHCHATLVEGLTLCCRLFSPPVISPPRVDKRLGPRSSTIKSVRYFDHLSPILHRVNCPKFAVNFRPQCHLSRCVF